MVCARCNQPMQPGDKFCDQCGATAPSTPPRKGNPAILVVVLLGVIMIGLLSILGWRYLPPLLASSRSEPTPSPTTAIPPTALTVPTPTPEPVPELDAFAHTWVTDMNTVIDLGREGSTLVGPKLRLSRVDPADRVLHGSYIEDNGNSIPATAELSADQSELILTLAPPQGGDARVVLKRQESSAQQPEAPVPSAYVPPPHARLTFQARYPDGDSGTIEVVMQEPEDDSLGQQLELATSKLYPGEPIRTVYRYVQRADGLHRLSKTDDELWLPSRLEPGVTWTSQGWKCRLTSVGSRLDLGIAELECLVVERENSAVGVSETSWIAPGHGEVLVKMGKMEARRLTSVQSGKS